MSYNIKPARAQQPGKGQWSMMLYYRGNTEQDVLQYIIITVLLNSITRPSTHLFSSQSGSVFTNNDTGSPWLLAIRLYSTSLVMKLGVDTYLTEVPISDYWHRKLPIFGYQQFLLIVTLSEWNPRR